MDADAAVTTEILSGEARFILQHLSTNAADGGSNHMADVRTALEEAVTLDFADYLKFLKKFNYITLNRQEHTLGLTEGGVRVVDGYDIEQFAMEISEYFSHRIASPKVIVDSDPNDPHTRVAKTGSHDLRYVKYDEIGSGGLGTVFRGRHTALGIDVAIKEIKNLFGYFSFLERSEVSTRLEMAVKAQATLSHPCVVEVVDLEADVAHPFFVMEFCEGGSLRERLDDLAGGAVPEKVALRWFLQILYAVREAHQSELVHRNLKPENVLFDARGNVKVGDFGLTRILEVDPDQVQALPQVFLAAGGMGYMAPEQLERDGEVGPASDIFALGILLYEMLVGRTPGRRAPLPSEVSKSVDKKLDDIFDRMTRDRATERYPDVDAVLDDFYAAFDSYARHGDLLLYVEPPSLGSSEGGEKSSKKKKANNAEEAEAASEEAEA